MDYANYWNKEYNIDGNYKLKGFSRGGLRTSFILFPHKIFLDAGVPSIIKPNLILITHGHQDHIDALYTNLLDTNKVQVIASINLIPWLQSYLDASKSLNCMDNKKFTNWLPKPIVKKTNVTVNSTKFNIEAIHLDHEVETLGYGISEVRTKLRDEYKNYTQEELNKMDSKIICEERLYPIVFFCGDMANTSLESLPFATYNLFVIECTFLFPEHKIEAIEKLHLHIDDIIIYVEQFPNCKFILIHFSCRYNKNDIRIFSNKYEYLKNLIFWI